jgi:hypothetical protein
MLSARSSLYQLAERATEPMLAGVPVAGSHTPSLAVTASARRDPRGERGGRTVAKRRAASVLL